MGLVLYTKKEKFDASDESMIKRSEGMAEDRVMVSQNPVAVLKKISGYTRQSKKDIGAKMNSRKCMTDMCVKARQLADGVEA